MNPISTDRAGGEVFAKWYPRREAPCVPFRSVLSPFSLGSSIAMPNTKNPGPCPQKRGLLAPA